MDTTRLFFALFLGASATTALLVAVAPLAARGPGEAPSRGRWAVAGGALVLLVAWLVVVAALANDRRALSPTLSLAVPVALALLGAVGPVRRVLGEIPSGVRLGLGALRLFGLVRLGALAAGWLPAAFALGASGLDLALGVAAVVLSSRAAAPSRAAMRVYAALSVVASVGVTAWAQASLRPLPAWELLVGGFVAPLWALVALAATAAPRQAD